MLAPPPATLEAIPDFVVLFDPDADSGPLFELLDPMSARCNADVLTSLLWTLSRFEEFEPATRDEHGRFPAAASAMHRNGVLYRPIVDEYGLAFRQVLERLLPGWSASPPALRIKLSHDMDQVGFPRSLRTTVGHLYSRKLPRAFMRDVASMFGAGLPAYLQAAMDFSKISRERGLDSAFYWKASERATQWDTGYALQHRPIRSVIEYLIAAGFEIGVHPAYDTFDSQERLDEELSNVRRFTGDAPVGGRTHYLRWNPSTWLAWERAGFAYDSTIGFHDDMGFRAGTAWPYHPWSMEEDRELRLLEIPLIVMDCTPISYMGLDADETARRVAVLVRRCETVGGVFTLLWHTQSLIEAPYAALYPRILEMLPGNARYDHRADAALAPVPRARALRAVPEDARR